MTASLDGLLWMQPPDLSWYGLQPWWQRWLEAGARAEHRADLQFDLNLDRISYSVPIEVRGRREALDLRIEFHRWPRYDCYDLPPEEYPRVFAAPGATSPHRMPDDALCLYYPHSPPWRRWRPADGLLALIDLARDHVFFEDYWRATGGHRGGTWLGEEAPHGFPEVAA